MKLFISLFLLAASTWAFGYSYFQPFYGMHDVASRYCEKGDYDCVHMTQVHLGLDAGNTPMLTEYKNDGSPHSISLWEGKIEDEDASTYGTAGLTASWTKVAVFSDGSAGTESVYVWRDHFHSPVWYRYERTSYTTEGNRTRFQRTFKLRQAY